MNPIRAAHRRAFAAPRAFAGAQVSRLTDDWIASILSADQEVKCSLRTLRARSRQLCQDNAHLAGWLTTLADQVVGWEPDGIRVQARNRDRQGTLQVAINRELERAFQRWAEPGTCSADGMDGFGDLQRLAVRLMAQDGEVLFRLLRGVEGPFGFALQQLDADLVDESLNAVAGPGGREIRMGIERDRYGRPVVYHCWDRHPADGSGPRTRVAIPAEDILHLFIRLRPGQTRGVPWTTPILIAMRMLDGYTEAEVMQARIAASAGGFFEMTGEDAQTFGDVYQQPTGEDGEKPPRLTMDLEPGLARQLPPGLKWSAWDPTHPNGNFPDFQKAILRTVARGVNTAYPTFTGDLEAVNYGSMRGGSLLERDGYRLLQRFLWTRLVHPVYRAWLPLAQLAGGVALPSYTAADYDACKPEFRGWPWIDPLNDIQAREREIRLGVNSRQRICAEIGRDFEEILAELAEEHTLAAAAGVDIDGVEAEPTEPADDSRAGNPPPMAANGNGRTNGHAHRLTGLLPLTNGASG